MSKQGSTEAERKKHIEWLCSCEECGRKMNDSLREAIMQDVAPPAAATTTTTTAHEEDGWNCCCAECRANRTSSSVKREPSPPPSSSSSTPPAAAAAVTVKTEEMDDHPTFMPVPRRVRGQRGLWVSGTTAGERIRRAIIRSAGPGELGAVRVLCLVPNNDGQCCVPAGRRQMHIEMYFSGDGAYRHFKTANRAQTCAMVHAALAHNQEHLRISGEHKEDESDEW